MKLPAFFFDIDGTLLEYRKKLTKISKRNQDALDALRVNYPTFIASGRTKCFIDDAITSYPFDGFITCNGAYIEYQNKCIYKKAIPADAIQRTIEFAEKYHAVVYFEGYDKIYVYNSQLPSHTWFIQTWHMKEETIETTFDENTIEAYIGMILFEDESHLEKVYQALGNDFDISRHVNQNSFDLTLKGENKAKGIQEVMHYFHATSKEAVAFGDGNNDLEMIELVGLGIAMGNAVEPLKQIADDITANVEDDGVAKALEKHGFIGVDD